MIDIAELSIGSKVHYVPSHGKIINGIVKEVPEHSVTEVRVVYNCAGDWQNYKDYTSALTNIKDLRLGWNHSSRETYEYIYSLLSDSLSTSETLQLSTMIGKLTSSDKESMFNLATKEEQCVLIDILNHGE